MKSKTITVTSTELEPTNGRASFYRKAHVLDDGHGTKWLKSYDTVMCSVDALGRVRRHGDWVSGKGRRSSTTGAHLKSFFETYDVRLEVKDFYKMPLVAAPDLVQRI